MKIGLDIVFFMCIIHLWIAKESNSQESFCTKGVPVVYFCTNSEVTMATYANIDAVNIPKFKQTFCECIIAPFHHGHDEVEFRFYFSGTYSKSTQLKINDIMLESPIGSATVYLTGETMLYFSTAEKYTTEEACLLLTTNPPTVFNISCMQPKRTVSVTSADTTEASKDNITTHTQRRSNVRLNSSGKLTAIVVPAIIGVLLILTVSVIHFVYIKRRRLAKETRHNEEELHHIPALSEPVTEQGQCQQNIVSGEEWGLDISVNPYERLNMYVNDNIAGEMHQQPEADKNEEYQEIHDVKNISENQDRHFTKETVFQEGNVQEYNSNETSPNGNERLDMYVNDTLPGEMYQQHQTDKTDNVLGESVPGSEHITGVTRDRATDTNENTLAVYTNAISQEDEYDDIA